VSETKDSEKKTQKARLREIELKKAEVELRAAESDFEYDQIRLARERRSHAWLEHGDRNHGIFRMESYVGGSVIDLAAEIQQYTRVNPGKPVTLYICSPGGSLFAGWVLYDALRTASAQGHHVTTILRGYAASMAGVLFMAGDTRLVGSEGFLMIHEISTGAVGKLSEIADEVDLSKRLNRRIEDIFVARSKIKRPEFRKKSTRADWWLSPQECIELGVAHAIG